MNVLHRKKLDRHISLKRRTAKREPRAPVFSGPNRSKATRLSHVDPQPMQPAASTPAGYGPAPRTPTKSHKGAILVPEPQQAQIRLMYVQGLSMTKIAKAVHRDVHTISKIVRSEEMLELQEAVRKRYWATAMQAVDSVGSHLERDGWLAHQVLKDIGVIPNQRQMEQLQMTEQKSEAEEEADVLDWTQRLLEVVVRQHKIFNLPLPELEQIEDEEKEDKRPLLERRDRPTKK